MTYNCPKFEEVVI